MDTFEELMAGLRKSRVDFMLVGGLAVALCGYTRTTLDVDILVETSADNLERLLACLEHFGEGAAREPGLDDFPVEEGCVRVVEAFPPAIFTLMNGRTYADLLPFTREHPVDDVTIRHLNAEGLLLLKRDSLRPKDPLDVLALNEIIRHQRG